MIWKLLFIVITVVPLLMQWTFHWKFVCFFSLVSTTPPSSLLRKQPGNPRITRNMKTAPTSKSSKPKYFASPRSPESHPLPHHQNLGEGTSFWPKNLLFLLMEPNFLWMGRLFQHWLQICVKPIQNTPFLSGLRLFPCQKVFANPTVGLYISV